MSIEAFERRKEVLKLQAKLAAVEQGRLSGQLVFSISESRKRLEAIYRPDFVADYPKLFRAML